MTTTAATEPEDTKNTMVTRCGKYTVSKVQVGAKSFYTIWKKGEHDGEMILHRGTSQAWTLMCKQASSRAALDWIKEDRQQQTAQQEARSA